MWLHWHSSNTRLSWFQPIIFLQIWIQCCVFLVLLWQVLIPFLNLMEGFTTNPVYQGITLGDFLSLCHFNFSLNFFSKFNSNRCEKGREFFFKYCYWSLSALSSRKGKWRRTKAITKATKNIIIITINNLVPKTIWFPMTLCFLIVLANFSPPR